MNSGRYVISQLLDLVHWETLARFAQRYDAEKCLRHFGCHQQLISMVFAQLTWREVFRWIKQHLRIKNYYGNTPNAVKTQIWIALCVYLIIAILHKQLKLPGTLYRIIQVLSVHPFEKTPIDQLLMEQHYENSNDSDPNQLMLWNL